MSLWSDWSERVRALLFPARRERELAEELRFHLEQDIADRVRRGDDPARARRAALAASGGVEHVKENVRDASGVRPLQNIIADFRHALRSLRRDPMYTVTAVLVLGLGLGAGAAVLAVADSVLFSPLPYAAAHRLVRVGQLFEGSTSVWQLSTVDAQAILGQQRSFESFGLVNGTTMGLSGAGTPERIPVGRVTAGFFRALAIAPVAGRLIGPADEPEDAPPVVVFSHPLAQLRFGSAQGALGRSVTLDGVSHTVVGVLPPGRDILGPGIRGSAWSVLRLPTPTRRGPFWLRGVGRLRADVSVEDARRDLARISERVYPLWASSFRDQTARITPMPLLDSIVGGAGRSVALFAAGVILVLLVAIVNVATLSLVRASARAPELGVRAALGASPLRLARLPLAEGVALAAAGGLLGLGLAALAVRLVARHARNLPRVQDLALDGTTVLGLLLAALATALLVSAPAVLAAVRASFRAARRAGDARRTGVDLGTMRLRRSLVVAQFALALPLLLGASLLFRSFLELQKVNPGFDPGPLVTGSVSLPTRRFPEYPEVQRFWRLLEQRLAEAPALEAAGLADDLPPGPIGNVNNFDLLDRPVPPGGAEHLAPWLNANADYFQVLGIRLLEGRPFGPADSGAAPPVVLVSRAWAERYYPGESAVGRRMIEGGCTTCPPTTVVGVVSDVKYQGLTAPAEVIYGPLTQSLPRTAHIVARGRTTRADAVRAVRELVSSLDPELPVVEGTLQARMDAALAAPGRSTAVLSGFAAVAVLLAALGIFGLTSYAVRQRRREIGVRIALGADTRAILRMIVGQGLRSAAIGTTIGLGLTLLEARWLQAFLFEVPATDPLSLLGAAAGLLLVALGACWLPGLRGSRIDPVRAIASD